MVITGPGSIGTTCFGDGRSAGKRRGWPLEKSDLPRLRGELTATAYAIARLLTQTSYDEAELAKLDARRAELKTAIAALEDPPPPPPIELTSRWWY